MIEPSGVSGFNNSNVNKSRDSKSTVRKEAEPADNNKTLETADADSFTSSSSELAGQIYSRSAARPNSNKLDNIKEEAAKKDEIEAEEQVSEDEVNSIANSLTGAIQINGDLALLAQGSGLNQDTVLSLLS